MRLDILISSRHYQHHPVVAGAEGPRPYALACVYCAPLVLSYVTHTYSLGMYIQSAWVSVSIVVDEGGRPVQGRAIFS